MNMFKSVAPIAARIFNQVNPLIPEVIESRIVETDTGELLELNESRNLMVSALNIILVNGGTQDNWLHESLQTNLNEVIPLDAATKINRFLIEQGVIEKRGTTKEIFNTRTNRIETRKLWELTTDWKLAVQEAMLKPEYKFKPLADGESLDFEPNRIKGASRFTDNSTAWAAIEQLDSVELKYSSIAMDLLKMRKEQLKLIDTKTKEGRDKQESGVIELKTLVKEIRDRGETPFTLTHTHDSRFRMYAKGGVVSTQASKVQKGVIRFAEAWPVDQKEIDIAIRRLNHVKDAIEIAAINAEPEHAIIRLDGCCNGIQWMSALTGNDLGMELTNLTGSDDKDLYEYFGNQVGLTRDEAKKVVMPYGYGASKRSIMRKLPTTNPRKVETLIEELDSQLPIRGLLTHIKMEAEFADGDTFEWTLPDGAHVVSQYTESDVVTGGKFSIAIEGTERIDRDKMIRALLPNIIHSIDAYHARMVINACNFPLVVIHDSFGCHSCNVKTLRKVIKHEFKKIVEADLLNDILKQLGFETYGQAADPSVITNSNMFK